MWALLSDNSTGDVLLRVEVILRCLLRTLAPAGHVSGNKFGRDVNKFPYVLVYNVQYSTCMQLTNWRHESMDWHGTCVSIAISRMPNRKISGSMS